MIFSHGTSIARGICIAFRPNLETKILSQPVCDDNGRYIIVYVEIQGSPFVLVHCYAPNTESSQVKLFKEILAQLGNLEFDQDSGFILTGDSNLIFDTLLDSLSGKPQLNKRSIFHFKILMEDLELVDIWRVKNPTFRQFTWKCKTALKMRRLDFFLIADTLQSSVSLCEILNPLESDHSPVKIGFKSPYTVKGLGYWKFNNSLLDDNNFVQNMKQVINEIIPLMDNYNDPRIGWEYLKFKMREYARDIAIKNAKERKKT